MAKSTSKMSAARVERNQAKVSVTPFVSVTPKAAMTRLNLRAPEKSQAALTKALGITLPQKPKQSAEKKGRHALWLGPDEWLILDEGEADLMAAAGKAKAFHAATDISHRNVAFDVKGAQAVDCLGSGCPHDLRLSNFPVGACSRTICGKAEVVLYRVGEDHFHVEVWQSFAEYLFDLLDESARSLAAIETLS